MLLRGKNSTQCSNWQAVVSARSSRRKTTQSPGRLVNYGPTTPVNAAIKRIVIASGNAGKVREISKIFESSNCEIIPQSDLGISSVPETGATFADNALIKARHAAEKSGLPTIADDSGLVVAALDGRPGVHSARYAGADASDDDNVEKLLAELREFPDGERTVTLDCDVLQADGGTRTAAISGAYVALLMAMQRLCKDRKLKANPVHGQIAAVSVGIYNGVTVLDLDYPEDSQAETDMNVVMNGAGRFIEVQGTAEGVLHRR